LHKNLTKKARTKLFAQKSPRYFGGFTTINYRAVVIYLQLYFLAGVLHDPPYTEGGSEMPYREERETRRLGEPSRFVFIRHIKRGSVN
jgi:hypothetical protein